MRTVWLEMRPVAAAIVLTALAGCSNLSGVGGSSEYSCKAPPGVRCESVSGIYASAVARNLPSQREQRPAPTPQSDERRPATEGVAQPVALTASNTAPADAAALTPMKSLRTPARILRLWFKPWEDQDLDLFDQGYIYVQVDGGRWMVDRAQREVRRGFTPVRPPKSADAASPRSADTAPARPVSGAPAGFSPEAIRNEAAERVSALRGSLGTATESE